MNTSYLALLRGINVGGKNMIKMVELKACLEKAGFTGVRTYIQSGNVLFASDKSDTAALALNIEKAIAGTFGCQVGVVVFSRQRWQQVIDHAPKEWGIDLAWKHNILVMLEPYDMQEVIAAIGTLKPDIETLVPGDGVLYQSMSRELFGRTTTGKLASVPIYKRMTIRNYNTVKKLAALLESS